MSGKRGRGGRGPNKPPKNPEENAKPDAEEQGEAKPESFKFDFGGQGAVPLNFAGIQSVFDFAGKDAGLVKLIEKRLGVGMSSGYLESLPQEVQNRVKALKKLHESKLELDGQLQKELEALEKKYEALQKPLFDQRAAIVLGQVEPTPEERGDKVWEVKEEEQKTEKKAEEKKEPPKEGKGIPEFWLTVLKHHDEFAEMITERDEAALKHLLDVRTRSHETEPSSFVLEFDFAENEFFENQTLTKTYHLVEDKLSKEIMYDHTETSPIKWKAGKNLTVRKVVKEQRVKGGKSRGRRGRGGAGPKPTTITVEEPCPSFFHFFSEEPPIPQFEDDEEEEFDEEEALQAALEADYEMGVELMDKIIPNAIMYFTGEANEGMYEEGDDDDDEGDDEEYDSEEDEDFPEEQQGGQPPQAECKQQ